MKPEVAYEQARIAREAYLRKQRIFEAHASGVPVKRIAEIHGISTVRAYQLLAAYKRLNA